MGTRGAAAIGAMLSLAAGPSVAAGSGAEALYRQALAATCASCHGTEGRAPAGVVWGGLAGMPAAVLAERLREFRSGTRPSTVMRQLAAGYSDAQIDALAATFAAQQR